MNPRVPGFLPKGTVLPVAGVHHTGASLTSVLVAQALTDVGCRLLVQRADAIIGERAIVGEPTVMRRFVCQLEAPGQWRVAHVFRVSLHEHRLTHRATVLDADELLCWAGGCASVPFSRAEVLAIEADQAP